MRVSPVALMVFLSLGVSSNAFVGPATNPTRSIKSTSSFSRNDHNIIVPRSRSALQSLTAPIPPGSSNSSSSSSSNKKKINNKSNEELMASHLPSNSNSVSSSSISSVGRILEGGKVIDFESMRGPSRAEHALRLAKEEVVSQKLLLQQSEGTLSNTPNSILGINAEVVAEVGHELGMFATTKEIQNCATYLRSQAPAGFFSLREPSDNTFTHGAGEAFTPNQKADFNRILRQAFVESGEVTSAFAKTFYMGTQLLAEAPREAIWAVYVWCRRTDEIVDAPRDSNDEMLKDLGAWEMRLENLWKYGEVVDVFDLCLLDVLVKYPTLPITPFVDMIRGMLMDVPELGQDRYETFDDLHLYCYRVAGTVGLMSLPVFGCANGYDEIVAK
jgi:phytoene synthase